MATQTEISTFARILDGLRNKSEAELKMLYIQFFTADIAKEFDEVARNANFENVTDEDIVKAVQKIRYKSK